MEQLFGTRYATKQAYIYPNNERTRKILKQQNEQNRLKMAELEKVWFNYASIPDAILNK